MTREHKVPYVGRLLEALGINIDDVRDDSVGIVPMGVDQIMVTYSSRRIYTAEEFDIAAGVAREET